jgi:hypothetical protein
MIGSPALEVRALGDTMLNQFERNDARFGHHHVALLQEYGRILRMQNVVSPLRPYEA